MALAYEEFVPEIEFAELDFGEVVGKGTFGTVQRARWRGQDVAVKKIETESERKAFLIELKQLSRVSHPNIVNLYGACRKEQVCLVMEYAEGGSLYNVLHGSKVGQPHYTAAHAMSWCLQTAVGIEYLHTMKPRGLIHRDLKPPNLLLVSGGTILKICDFGTACDIQTHMTNNKGSAAWMAPEVFEGSNYSEKCDIFSWGIILWEVFSRKKPFEEIGGPAFRIMWAVHEGTRPPLLSNMPKPLELLMTRCWSKVPADRPSMTEVVRIMSYLYQFFRGADEPLVYPVVAPVVQEQDRDFEFSNLSLGGLTLPTNMGCQTTDGAYNKYITPKGVPVPQVSSSTPKSRPVVVEEEQPRNKRTSAPASLTASRESLESARSRASTPSSEIAGFPNKRHSADLTLYDSGDIMRMGGTCTPPRPEARFMKTHRRSGSYDNGPFSPYSTNPSDSGSPSVGTPNTPPAKPTLHHSVTAPGRMSSPPPLNNETSPFHAWGEVPSTTSTTTGTIPELTQFPQFCLEYQILQPLPDSEESAQIYQDHSSLAREYVKKKTELMVLKQRKDELAKVLASDPDEEQQRIIETWEKITDVNENLMNYHKKLKAELEELRKAQQNNIIRNP